MSKKTLNKENLKNLGADRLADLVLDLVKENAALQRRSLFEGHDLALNRRKVKHRIERISPLS